MTSHEPKVLWGSTVGYPSDSLASCFTVRCPSLLSNLPGRPRRRQVQGCRSSGPSSRSSAASRRGVSRWTSSTNSGTGRRWTHTKWVDSCSDSLRTCSGHGTTNAGSCYRDSRTNERHSAKRSKNCETATLLWVTNGRSISQVMSVRYIQFLLHVRRRSVSILHYSMCDRQTDLACDHDFHQCWCLFLHCPPPLHVSLGLAHFLKFTIGCQFWSVLLCTVRRGPSLGLAHCPVKCRVSKYRLPGK